MPEREFDLYLSLLSKMLRLNPLQRSAITDEMRDHLEERFSELVGQGRSRDDAIRIALDEFGDAAAVAADFTHVSKRKTRRFLMRLTVGSVVVTTLGILLASAFWPEVPNAPAPSNAIAQAPNTVAGVNRSGGIDNTAKKSSGLNRPDSEIEKKLATQLKSVEWEEIPLATVLTDISIQINGDIVIDKKFFDEIAVDPKKKITLALSRTKISARTALEMALERAGAGEAAITDRDGIIYLTNPEQDRKTVVYNCRDLFDDATATYAAAMKRHAAGGGGGFFSLQAGLQVPQAGGGDGAGSKRHSAPGGGGMGGGGLGGGGMGPAMNNTQLSPPQTIAKALINVVQQSVRSTSWQDIDGDGATITVFNGLVVVSANHEAHREIKELFEMLRTAAAQKVGAGKQVKPRRRKTRIPTTPGAGSGADPAGGMGEAGSSGN